MDRCKIGQVGTEHVPSTSSGLLRPKPSFLAVLLILLSFSALLAPSGCGKDEKGGSSGQGADQSDGQGGGQEASGISEDVVRRLDRAIMTQMRDDALPGVVVGVRVPGEGIYMVARGKANLKTGEQRDVHDPFHRFDHKNFRGHGHPATGR